MLCVQTKMKSDGRRLLQINHCPSRRLRSLTGGWVSPKRLVRTGKRALAHKEIAFRTQTKCLAECLSDTPDELTIKASSIKENCGYNVCHTLWVPAYAMDAVLSGRLRASFESSAIQCSGSCSVLNTCLHSSMTCWIMFCPNKTLRIRSLEETRNVKRRSLGQYDELNTGFSEEEALKWTQRRDIKQPEALLFAGRRPSGVVTDGPTTPVCRHEVTAAGLKSGRPRYSTT